MNNKSKPNNDPIDLKDIHINKAAFVNTGTINEQHSHYTTIIQRYDSEAPESPNHQIADTVPIQLQEKPEYGGLKGLLPPVYYPMFLGRESDDSRYKDKNIPQEMPDTGWRESHLPIVGFQRIGEEKVFKKYFNSVSGGVYLVLGEPGSGKSTLLAQWYKRARNKLGVVKPVVWLDLGKVTLEAVSELSGLSNQYPLILLDSWDEASDEVQIKIKRLLPEIPGDVVISCRSAVYSGEFEHLCSKQVKTYYVMGLRPSDQKAFIEELTNVWRQSHHADLVYHKFSLVDDNWCTALWQVIQEHPQVGRLATSPLLLTLIAYMQPPSGVTNTRLPDNKLAFFEKACNWLCKNRIDKFISEKAVKELKQFLVLVVNETELTDNLDELHLRAVFEGRFKHEYASCKLYFEQVELYLTAAGLLRKSPVSGNYQFLHKSFQEWLLATALYPELKLVTAVAMYWQDTNYHNTLALMWNLATSIERHTATKFLIDQGCQRNPHHLDRLNLYDSGLMKAIQIWYDSGLNMRADTLMLLKDNINNRSRKLYIAQDTASCGQLLAELATDDDEDVRCCVARNPITPAYVLTDLMIDENMIVRVGVAGNGNAPDTVLVALATDDSKDVRCTLVLNTKTPAIGMAALARDVDVDVREGVAICDNTPKEVLVELAKDIDEDVRKGVANNVNTPANTLAKLAADDNMHVRGISVYNSNFPVKILSEMMHDVEEGVRGSIALNANTPEKVLTELARDDHFEVRRCVADNPNTPLKILSGMAKDADDGVRNNIALNINAPAKILAELACDDHIQVRRSVGLNIKTPVNILSKLAVDDDEYVRRNIATNVNTSAKVLTKLASDNYDVVQCVAENPSTPVEVLAELKMRYENEPYGMDIVDFKLNRDYDCLELMDDKSEIFTYHGWEI